MYLPNVPNSRRTLVESVLFEEVRDKFLQTLPARERSLFSKCASAELLLADARKWEITRKNRIQGSYYIGKIKNFSDCLQPYFEAVGIIVSSNPEYAAIAWGAIRLVLQLASNFSTFFDKLTITLCRLSEQLPGYDNVLEILNKNPSDRLKISLQKVYVDLFQFLTNIVRIFTRKDGTSKSSAVVVIKLLWKPFDTFFETILEDLRFHADLVRDEIIIEQLKISTVHSRIGLEEQERAVKERIAAAEAREATTRNEFFTSESIRLQEKKNEEDSFSRIKKWISPPEFMAEFEKAQNTRDEGTAEWLFDEHLFNQWADKEFSTPSCTEKQKFGKNTLWIRGNPGCGKTILAAATVDFMKNQQYFSRMSKGKVYHFFFRSGFPTLSDRTSAYRAILAQMLQTHRRDHDLVDKFAFIMNEDSEGQLRASCRQLNDLLKICLQCLGECVLVFDGIDECHDIVDLTADLIQYSIASDVKLVMFGRPNVFSLVATIPEQQQLNIARSTSRDINLYLTRKLQVLLDERLLPKDFEVRELVGQLTNSADGMFLWAYLMIKYLNSWSLTPRRRLNTIVNISLPEGLEAMYNRISDLICQGNEDEQSLAKQIITWLSCSKRLLTADELYEAIKLDNPDKWDEMGDDSSDFNQVVLLSCAGLVEREIVYSPDHGFEITTFRFIHLSIQEFFLVDDLRLDQSLSKKSQTSIFLSCVALEAHCEISRVCLQHLTYSTPAQPLSGRLGSDVCPLQLDVTFPLLKYSALTWIEHIGEAKEIDPVSSPNTCSHSQARRLLLQLTHFISKKMILMAWIETSYTFGKIPEAEKLRQWCHQVTQTMSKSSTIETWVSYLCDDILEFSHYLKDLDTYWSANLMESPGSIWEEITAFTPSRFLAQNTSTIVNSLVAAAPSESKLSIKYLSKISEETSDGRCVHVLSIWPSRYAVLCFNMSSQYPENNIHLRIMYRNFEQLAEKKLAPSLQLLDRLSSGWVAIFEVWSISDPVQHTLKHSIRIPLLAEEIQVKIHQSFWCEATSREQSYNWKLQFPISVGANMMTFSILRTIYRFHPATKGLSSFYDSVRLPVYASQRLNTIWSRYISNSQQNLRISRIPTISSPLELGGDLYLYWMTFSDDGKLLFYTDQRLRSPKTVAMFEIGGLEKLEVSFLRSTSLTVYTEPGTEKLDNLKIAFHPKTALVGFLLAESVYLWSYKKGEHESQIDFDQEIIFYIFLYSHLLGGTRMLIEKMAIDDREPVQLYLETDKVTNLEFSRCGQSIVFWTASSKLPFVEPIPEDILDSYPQTDLNATISKFPIDGSNVASKCSSNIAASVILNPPETAMSTLGDDTKHLELQQTISRNNITSLESQKIAQRIWHDAGLRDSHLRPPAKASGTKQPLSGSTSDNTVVEDHSNSAITLQPTSNGEKVSMHDFQLIGLKHGSGQNYPSEMIRKNYTEIQDDGSSTGILSDFSSNRLELRVWSKTGEITEERVVELSKLPAWPGLSSASASVGLPQGTGTFVKIVLNKKADSWCDVTDVNDEHLPAVVLRERGSLKTSPPNNYKLLSDTDEMTSLTRLAKRAPAVVQACPFEFGHYYRSLHAGTRIPSLHIPSPLGRGMKLWTRLGAEPCESWFNRLLQHLCLIHGCFITNSLIANLIAGSRCGLFGISGFRSRPLYNWERFLTTRFLVNQQRHYGNLTALREVSLMSLKIPPMRVGYIAVLKWSRNLSVTKEARYIREEWCRHRLDWDRSEFLPVKSCSIFRSFTIIHSEHCVFWQRT